MSPNKPKLLFPLLAKPTIAWLLGARSNGHRVSIAMILLASLTTWVSKLRLEAELTSLGMLNRMRIIVTEDQKGLMKTTGELLTSIDDNLIIS